MSNPESEIQQGATVLNISSVCPKCGEVFCKEHNVYGLAVKQLTDEIATLKESRAVSVECEQTNHNEANRLRAENRELKVELNRVRRVGLDISDLKFQAEAERDELREMLRYIAYQRTAVGITVMEMLLDEERQRKIHQLLEGK